MVCKFGDDSQRTNKVGESCSVFKVVQKFKYLGGNLNSEADIEQELRNRYAQAYARLKKFSKKVYHNRLANGRHFLKLKVRLCKQEIIEALLYGVATWTLTKKHFKMLRGMHRRMLLHISGFPRSSHDESRRRFLAYTDLLKLTDCEPIETTIRYRRLKYLGEVLRMDDTRLPKQVLFGDLQVVSSLKKNKTRTWKNIIKQDLESFDINVKDWKQSAVEKGVWLLLLRQRRTDFSKLWILEAELENTIRRSTYK